MISHGNYIISLHKIIFHDLRHKIILFLYTNKATTMPQEKFQHPPPSPARTQGSWWSPCTSPAGNIHSKHILDLFLLRPNSWIDQPPKITKTATGWTKRNSCWVCFSQKNANTNIYIYYVFIYIHRTLLFGCFFLKRKTELRNPFFQGAKLPHHISTALEPTTRSRSSSKVTSTS